MTKQYTDAEYRAMVGKLCRFSVSGNHDETEIIGILHTITYIKGRRLFLFCGRLYDRCEPIPYAEAIQYIYQPEIQPEDASILNFLTVNARREFIHEINNLKLSADAPTLFDIRGMCSKNDFLGLSSTEYIERVRNDWGDQPEPAKRTKDNLFVGLRPEWRFATINQHLMPEIHRDRPELRDGDILGSSFGWHADSYSEPIGHILNIEPWIDISDPEAWKNSRIERPEGV